MRAYICFDFERKYVFTIKLTVNPWKFWEPLITVEHTDDGGKTFEHVASLRDTSILSIRNQTLGEKVMAEATKIVNG
jgi:hypothetical protein